MTAAIFALTFTLAAMTFNHINGVQTGAVVDLMKRVSCLEQGRLYVGDDFCIATSTHSH